MNKIESISKVIHVIEQIDYENSQETINILKEALDDPTESTLPTRLGHVYVTVSTALLSLRVIPKIVLFIPIAFGRIALDFILKDMKFKRLAYNITRLVILDPFYILSEIIISVIQISSAIIGIIHPRTCTKWWHTAEQIHSFSLSLFVKLKYKKLGITDFNDKIYEIQPAQANFYLGSKNAFSLHKSTLPLSKQVLTLNLKNILSKFLNEIATNYKEYHAKISVHFESFESKKVDELETLYYEYIKPDAFFSQRNSGLSSIEYNKMKKATHTANYAIREHLYALLHFGSVRLHKKE